MTARRALVLVGVTVVVAAAVAVTSCHVYTKASTDLPVGAGYAVRAYHIRTPLRIAGETARGAGPHPSYAEPSGRDLGYETWLVQGERRVAQVSAEVPRPAAVRPDGRFYAYLAHDPPARLRVVRVSDGQRRDYPVPRHAYVFWEEPGVVRLVERDPSGAVTFLHEVRPDPGFLSTG